MIIGKTNASDAMEWFQGQKSNAYNDSDQLSVFQQMGFSKNILTNFYETAQ